MRDVSIRCAHAQCTSEASYLQSADDGVVSWDDEEAPATEVSFASCTYPGRGRAGPSGFSLAALKVRGSKSNRGDTPPRDEHVMCVRQIQS